MATRDPRSQVRVSRRGCQCSDRALAFPDLGHSCQGPRGPSSDCHEHPDRLPWDWYIDLVTIDVTPDQWRVTDHFIDVTVYEGERYELLDLDEFVDALEAGHLPVDTGLRTVRSLHQLCSELKDADFVMKSLLELHAPSLPFIQPWDAVSKQPDGGQEARTG